VPRGELAGGAGVSKWIRHPGSTTIVVLLAAWVGVLGYAILAEHLLMALGILAGTFLLAGIVASPDRAGIILTGLWMLALAFCAMAQWLTALAWLVGGPIGVFLIAWAIAAGSGAIWNRRMDRRRQAAGGAR
jgi:hypothetical protein